MASTNNISKLQEVLNFLGEENFQTYSHELIDYWLQRNEIRYNKYIQSINIENWWYLEEKFESICELFVNDRQNELNKFFDEAKLETEFRNLILKVLNVRKNDLLEYFTQKKQSMPDMQLKDFDWSLKLCLSSDKLSKLNEKKCALNLFKNSNEDISFEMNLNELNQFIETLESIEKANTEKFD